MLSTKPKFNIQFVVCTVVFYQSHLQKDKWSHFYFQKIKLQEKMYFVARALQMSDQSYSSFSTHQNIRAWGRNRNFWSLHFVHAAENNVNPTTNSLYAGVLVSYTLPVYLSNLSEMWGDEASWLCLSSPLYVWFQPETRRALIKPHIPDNELSMTMSQYSDHRGPKPIKSYWDDLATSRRARLRVYWKYKVRPNFVGNA